MQQKKQKDGIATTLALCTRLPQYSLVVGASNGGTFAGGFAFDDLAGAAFSVDSFRVVLVP